MTQSQCSIVNPTLRLVFDTNVLVSALLLPASPPRQAVDQALIHGKILLSDAVQTELYAVLSRKRFRQYIDEDDIRRFLVSLTREAEWVEVNTQLKVCRDPKDDKFLELAACGRATHLVTGDADLLSLKTFREVTILTPRALLDSVLDKRSNS